MSHILKAYSLSTALSRPGIHLHLDLFLAEQSGAAVNLFRNPNRVKCALTLQENVVELEQSQRSSPNPCGKCPFDRIPICSQICAFSKRQRETSQCIYAAHLLEASHGTGNDRPVQKALITVRQKVFEFEFASDDDRVLHLLDRSCDCLVMSWHVLDN